MSTATVPFSVQLREASASQHAAARTSGFVSALLGGGLGVDAFARYTEQLWFVYAALEGGTAGKGQSHGQGPGRGPEADPVAGPFLSPELARTPGLARDLAYLRGPDWRHDLAPLPATAAYAARIEECAASWRGGYLAHHYTRYLGDLSGGQALGDRAEKQWGFAHRGDGVRFYAFDGIGNPAAFKRDYHRRLDALPVSGREKARIVDECRRAFDHNSAVFRELGELYLA
ncbi:biliverdin-producing heme oxygenase [Streptomyces montanisoli]|uniref:Biliverdin-producing heme oxygenase n=1 Tax=Streptomyces montanisoli TaxID=2798581 RepID=A0A940RWT3_9ACTN|nr:biliverdin-producing heme oxygenase [Streptomyces montanisoli]MBP0460492.1 biliverdin-producing heme oxygenase [Streptomyces montanisoli]